MKNGIIIGILATTFSLFQANAYDVNGKSAFAPENNRYISVDDKATNVMTEQKFESIINRVYQTYAPIVKSKGATLKMVNNWKDGTVNAYADRNHWLKTWKIHMFGGLARHPLITDDGFLLVVCHELGHHIGGAPTDRSSDSSWGSFEGQADYFGTLKCLRRILQKDDNQSIISKMTIDPIVVSKCETIYKSANEIALCERIALAGKSLGMVLGDLNGNPKVDFSTPDKTVVSRTDYKHPEAQCRLDTYLSGALCDKAVSLDVSDKNPIDGTCIKRDGYTEGVRPLCWYKPGDNEI